MTTIKAEFVRSLQGEPHGLTPYEIGKKIRERYGFLPCAQFDGQLEIEAYRGYMLRYNEKPHRTPEDPEHFACVISTQQSHEWQQIIFVKEMLQILDSLNHRTSEKKGLAHIMDLRVTHRPHSEETPRNVVADKNGLTLALGSTVPRQYRMTLRAEKMIDNHSREEIAFKLEIPEECVKTVLDESFEDQFDKALEDTL